MSRVEESVDVDVPVHVAYNQWTQFETFPNFMEGVESNIQVDDTHNPLDDQGGRADARVRHRDHRAASRRADCVAVRTMRDITR